MNTLYPRRKICFLAVLLFLGLVVPQKHALAFDLTEWEGLARSLVQRAVGAKGRLLLFEHLPGVFPVRAVCYWTPKGGKRLTLLPGDATPKSQTWVTMECPGSFSADIGPGAVVRVESSRSSSAIEILEGVIRFSLEKGALKLALPGREWEVEVVEPKTSVIVSRVEKRSDILCEFGQWNLRSKRGAERSIDRIGHDACRGRIQMADVGRYLGSKSWLVLADFPAPSQMWPKRELAPFSKELGSSGVASSKFFSLISAAESAHKLMIMPGFHPTTDRTCLLDQINLSTGEAKLFKELKGQNNLSLDLPKEGAAYAATCYGPENSVAISDLFVVR